MPTTITYNGFNLNDNTYVTSDVKHLSAPSRSVTMFNLARTSGAIITDTQFTTKTINVTGTIIGTGMADLENKADTLQSALTVVGANLDISYGSGTRRYKSTVTKVDVDRPVSAAAFAVYSIDFVATDYGSDIADTNVFTATSLQATPTTKAFTLGGTAPLQQLDLVITITAIDVTNNNVNRSLTITNPATTEAITVTRVWANNDVLIIRNSDKSVLVNNGFTDWVGGFHTYSGGPGSFTSTHNFTAGATTLPTINADVNHRRKYI